MQDEAIESMRRKLEGVCIIKTAAEYIRLSRFDSIHCGHTLEHVEDLDKTLANIKLHAKGRVVISVPIHGGLSHIHLREWNSSGEVFKVLDPYFEVIEHRIFRKDDTVYSVVFITTVK